MKVRKIIWVVVLLTLVVLAGFYWSANRVVVPSGTRVVVCVPVYGQSLALGEEAKRLTDFDQLRQDYGGRIVTQRLDGNFGYFDLSAWKEWMKRMVRYQKRSNELSIYYMAQDLVGQLGEDTVVCIFPGGRGTTMIGNLSKDSEAYQKFLKDIRIAYDRARDQGCQMYVPAICWMQGESDITEYPSYDYKQQLLQWRQDIDADIRSITHQSQPVRLICYQPNAVTRACDFHEDAFECREVTIPQTFVELLREDTMFWASGPTYPYDFVREAIHIDGKGQQAIGRLAAASALGIIRKRKPMKGLLPLTVTAEGCQVLIRFHVPHAPLILDTVNVRKVPNYGFSVVMQDGLNKVQSVSVGDSTVILTCSQPVVEGCRIRYAVNGVTGKSGRTNGPRGNLRDVQNHWCYQFEESIR